MTAGHTEALRSRAKTGLLIAASKGSPINFAFWLGTLNACAAFDDGLALAMTIKDERLNGYEPPANLKAAWAALPERAETLALAEVQQILTAQGVQVAAQPIANGDVDARQQFKNSEVAIVNLHDEHAPAVVDGNDGACVAHGSVSGVGVLANVAQQGGAA